MVDVDVEVPAVVVGIAVVVVVVVIGIDAADDEVIVKVVVDGTKLDAQLAGSVCDTAATDISYRERSMLPPQISVLSPAQQVLQDD